MTKKQKYAFKEKLYESPLFKRIMRELFILLIVLITLVITGWIIFFVLYPQSIIAGRVSLVMWIGFILLFIWGKVEEYFLR